MSYCNNAACHSGRNIATNTIVPFDSRRTNGVRLNIVLSWQVK